MKKLVRVVMGSAAGMEIKIESNNFEIPIYPKFPTLNNMSAKTEIIESIKYRVHEMRFPEGHSHFYAAPAGVTLESLMNELWETYKK